MVTSFGNEHEFADITWYPSQRKAVYRIDDRVYTNTDGHGNGLYDFTPFRATASVELGIVRTTGQHYHLIFASYYYNKSVMVLKWYVLCLFKLEEVQESLSDATGKCLGAETVILALETTAYGLSNNGIVIFLFF